MEYEIEYSYLDPCLDFVSCDSYEQATNYAKKFNSRCFISLWKDGEEINTHEIVI